MYLEQIARLLEVTVETDVRGWFWTQEPLPGVEEVISLGWYGKTLTLLSLREGVSAA